MKTLVTGCAGFIVSHLAMLRGKNGEVYNIGSGKRTSINELANRGSAI